MKNPMEMTGLEFLQAMIEGHIPPASISKTIPMQPTEISEGSVTFKAQADHNHLNPFRWCTWWFCCNCSRFSDWLCCTYNATCWCGLWNHRS